MFKEFFLVLGGWKREGKGKDVESLTLNAEKTFLEHTTAMCGGVPMNVQLFLRGCLPFLEAAK